jgi:hypothetical protein
MINCYWQKSSPDTFYNVRINFTVWTTYRSTSSCRSWGFGRGLIQKMPGATTEGLPDKTIYDVAILIGKEGRFQTFPSE